MIPIPFFGWFGVVAALLFLIAIAIASIKSLVKPKLRIKIHRAVALAGAVSMLIHIFFALRIYF